MLSLFCYMCTTHHRIFSLPLGVTGWLCSVTAALPENLLYYFLMKNPKTPHLHQS